MKKKLLYNLLLLITSSFILFPLAVSAINPVLNGLTSATANTFIQTGEGKDGLSAFGLIGLIIRIALSILGVIFIGLMIYSGYNWMTAAGDQSKVSKAQDTIRRAIIGLIIVVASFSFWQFIQNVLFTKK